MDWYKNEKVLSFIGGAAAVIVGSKILKMPKTRELCVKGIAGRNYCKEQRIGCNSEY